MHCIAVAVENGNNFDNIKIVDFKAVLVVDIQLYIHQSLQSSVDLQI